MNSAAFENACACNHLPDACTNEEREEKLIRRQQKDDRPWFKRIISRDRNLLIACAVLILAMNVTEGRYLLYPFRIFGTWIHEMCHGLAALLTGGRISHLQIFRDGSGLAYTSTRNEWASGFVSSAGYPGTAVAGCLFLLFRRSTLGPTIGTIGLGVCMLLSVLFYVRNTFGCIVLPIEGVFLILAGWKFPAVWLDNLYNFLAATCCLNAVESIHDLFGSSIYYIDGEVASTTDAHSVAEKWGGDYRIWATIWLINSIMLTIIGIVLAFDARETVQKIPQYSAEPGVMTTPIPTYNKPSPFAPNYKPATIPAVTVESPPPEKHFVNANFTSESPTAPSAPPPRLLGSAV